MYFVGFDKERDFGNWVNYFSVWNSVVAFEYVSNFEMTAYNYTNQRESENK
jgi:hypothetical protein